MLLLPDGMMRSLTCILGEIIETTGSPFLPAKLLEQAQIHAEDIHFSDIESLFSLDDEYSPQALAVVAYSTSEGDSDPDSEYH